MRLGGNEYDLREFAGAFGDLGTLIPFLVGYITISNMDPVGSSSALACSRSLPASTSKRLCPSSP